jgi:hypothetical protein
MQFKRLRVHTRGVPMRKINDYPDPEDDGEFSVKGKQVVCAHCTNDRFRLGRAQLNTPGMTLLGLDWANRTASVLVCTLCGRIDWYADPPDRI